MIGVTDVGSRLPNIQATARFDLFISYSHASDRALAPAIQSTLQSLAKPLLRRRALRVFRDQTNLALAPELWPGIERALEQSRYFLLLASPESCRSEWVQRELRHWLTRTDGAQTLLIVLTGGELAWSAVDKDFDWSRTNAVPRLLSTVFPSEPFYLDLRWATGETQLTSNARFRDAVATIASTVRGVPKDDLIGEDLRRHKRVQAATGTVALLMTVLAAVAAWQATVANRRQQEAERQRQLAVSKQLVATGQVLRADVAGWPARSALMAIESLRLDHTLEATLLLRRALPLLAHVSITLRHPGSLRAIAASADLDAIATVGGDGQVIVWDRASGNRRATLNHSGEVQGILFSELGTRILTVSGVEVRSWSARTAKNAVTIAHSSAVVAAAINDTGDRIATASGDGLVTLWDGDTGAMIGRERREELVTALEFAGTGKSQLAVIAYDGRLQLFSSDNGRLLANLELGCERPEQLAIASSEPEIAAVLCDDGAIKMWDLNKRSVQGEWSAAPEVAVATPFFLDAPHSRLGIGSFGTMVAAGFRTGSVRLRSGAVDLPRLEHRDVVNAIAFSSDSNFIATASRDGTSRLWDANRGQEIVRWTADSQAALSSPSLYVRFSDDNRWLVSAFADGTVKLIEPTKQVTENVLFRSDEQSFPTMTVVPSTGQVVIADDRTLRFVDQADAEKSREIEVEHSIEFMVFSDDGRRVGLSTKYGMVVLDTASGSTLLEESQREIASMALNADGTRLVVAENEDRTVKVWDVDQGEEVWEVDGLDEEVTINGVAFLPGQQVVIWSGDPEDAERDAARGAGAVLWDLASAREVRRFSDAVAPTKVATALAVSRDGSVVAIVDGLNRVDLWDVRTGERRGRVNASTAVANLAFSPDGGSLAVGTVNSVRVWAVDSLVETAMFETTAQVDSIAFAGEGSKLAVLSAAVIELHPLRASDLIAAACQRLERNLSPAEWAANLGEGEPYRKTCPGLPAPSGSSAAPTIAEDTVRQTPSQPAELRQATPPAAPAAPSPTGAGKSPGGPAPAIAFRDCAECPEIVVLPAGSFTMGTPSEMSQRTDEGPPRRIDVPSFALGKYEVTRREFQYFLDQTGSKRAERCGPVGGEDHAADEPEVCLTEALTMGFLKWLSAKSGHSYRLPTDAEWEYAARGGTSTIRFWGNEASRACRFANVADRSARRIFTWDGVHACDDGYPAVAPVGKFPPNPFGLHDMLGNVGELVQEGLLRGGSYGDGPAMVSSVSRHRDDTSDWSSNGIRVARAAP